MSTHGQTWALVLGAGEGSRLRSLTMTDVGIAIPKQFCSLRGGTSLLHEALLRAEAVAAPEHICTIVAEQHQRWWSSACSSLPSANVIVQPQNRGTANGILLPLLHILARDPEARIVLLPSDQHVRDEPVLALALQQAVSQLRTRRSGIVLLGISPDEADPELGYIVPGSTDGNMLRNVKQFVEKPSSAVAQTLIQDGALWNAFIIAARGQALLQLFVQRFPQLVADMQHVVAHDESCPGDATAATHLYRNLPDIDFSRHVMQDASAALRVLPVPACGWNDLGTPQRVVQTLQRLPQTQHYHHDEIVPRNGFLNLAAQHARLQMNYNSLA